MSLPLSAFLLMPHDALTVIRRQFAVEHPHGAHLGLSDQEDGIFRHHMVLLAASLFLAPQDTWTP